MPCCVPTAPREDPRALMCTHGPKGGSKGLDVYPRPTAGVKLVFVGNFILTHWLTVQCTPLCTMLMLHCPSKRLMAQGGALSKRCCVMLQLPHMMNRVPRSAAPSRSTWLTPLLRMTFL